MAVQPLPVQKFHLDVGCGSNKRQGWIGLDRRELPGIDIIHDAEVLPWPLSDDSCAIILMSHLWEHLKPWLSIDIMNEMWRILAPGGQLQLVTPYGYSTGFLQDPTHCNPSNAQTWQYFDPQYELYGVYEPKPWHLKHYEEQMFGNQIVVYETRKDARAIKPKAAKLKLVTDPKERGKKGDVATLLKADVVNAFHEIFYERRTLTNQPMWMGRRVDKSPADLWRFQELIFDLKPGLIIELGTANGASALYFAHLLDVMGRGRIITVDIDAGLAPREENPSRTNPGERPDHHRISYLIGNSANEKIVRAISTEVKKKSSKPVMVILDSDHRKPHVSAELELYAPMVSKGSYLVVEDSNINGHPVYPDYGPGPYEALLAWMPHHPEFEVDVDLEERFPFTFNPMGWLRRMR